MVYIQNIKALKTFSAYKSSLNKDIITSICMQI